MEKLVIVFDCGATNIRTVAINGHGKIMAIESLPNQTQPDPTYPEGLIWDFEDIYNKLCQTALKVVSTIAPEQIVAVTTTTFGVDGGLIDAQGQLLSPIISWQCPRTAPILQTIGKYISLPELYAITGVNAYAFNTINKLIWYRENQPDLLQSADGFLFMPSLINFSLTGNRLNDTTMLGTAMLTELANRRLSGLVMQKIGVPPGLFGKIGEPGDKVGTITSTAAQRTGIPEGTPVFLAGHDTQFAIFGSGAQQNQPVLSSGTWEIMMTRSQAATSSPAQLHSGVTTEFDAIPGLYNIGVNWLGSGVVEWFRRMFYGNYSAPACYEAMIAHADTVPPGACGVVVDPDFGNLSQTNTMGKLAGINLQTTPGIIIRAVFEALSYTAKQSLQTLENAGNFKAEKLIVVGGGSKNRLWNQIRADVLGIPVETIQHKETTILGASFFAFASAGQGLTAEQVRESVDYAPETFFPSSNSAIYQELYTQWIAKLKRI